MKEVESAKEMNDMRKSPGVVAMFLYMPTCPHCKVMHEPWSELEREKPDVKFVKVDSDYVPSDMGITGFPHFMLMKDGKMVKSVGGEMSKDDLKAKLFSGGRRRRSTRRLRRATRKIRK